MLKLNRDRKLHIMHALHEHLLNVFEVINQGLANIPRPSEIVKSSIQFMNDLVLLLGDVLQTGTTKYSRVMITSQW